MTTYNTEKHSYLGYTIKIKCWYDNDMGPPWEEGDGYGPVSEWQHGRDNKRPGQRVLSQDRGSYRFYDWEKAIEVAKKDGWGLGDATKVELAKRLRKEVVQLTPGEITEEAVRRDFEYLRGWCNNKWHWVGFTTTIFDPDGEEIEMKHDSVGGFSSEYDAEMVAGALTEAKAYVEQLDEAEKHNYVI